MRLSELEAVVESLLFIAGDAVPLASIAQTIELDQATTRAVVLSLADKYEKEKRGLRIVEIADAYQMCTAAECFEYIRNMYKSPQRQGLTQSLLETLAIIAYKQPVTRGDIDARAGGGNPRGQFRPCGDEASGKAAHLRGRAGRYPRQADSFWHKQGISAVFRL